MSEVKRFRFVDANGYPAIMVCDSVKAERFVEEQEYDRLAVALEAESKGSDRAAEAMLAWKSDFDRVTAERDAALGREAKLIVNAERGKRKYQKQLQRLQVAVGQRNTYKGQVIDLQNRLTAADARVELLRKAHPFTNDVPRRKVHNLKIHAGPFEDLVSGAKTGEVRKCDDRDFQVGDSVELFLVDHTGSNATRSLVREITHIQRGYGLPDDLCVLSYAPAAQPQGEPVATVSIWHVDQWYASDPSKAGRNVGVKFIGDTSGLNDGQPLYAEQPAPVAVITYQQVFKAYEYAESHPHKYLRGTTNWCAAVAHSLNTK